MTSEQENKAASPAKTPSPHNQDPNDDLQLEHMMKQKKQFNISKMKSR